MRLQLLIPAFFLLCQTAYAADLSVIVRSASGAQIRYVDDLDFSSAYVLLDHEFAGERGLAGRVDWFEKRDNQKFNYNAVPEHGYAMTAAWRMPLCENLKLVAETVYVDSQRKARLAIGEQSRQTQLEAQASLRWSF
ncbi:MAG TPA: hypothetical protein VG735_02890 [Caulobacterales bacterium]|nr:hypothetical protein [Caulobacterales bacterium]